MIDFNGLRAILDAIAANGNRGIGGSPHGDFWNQYKDRNAFMQGKVVVSRGGFTYHVPITDSTNLSQSAILRILLGPFPVNEGGNSTSMPQMPFTGPYINDS